MNYLLVVQVFVRTPIGLRRVSSQWKSTGLTPKDHSSGGKRRLGGITHAGDEALRSVLVSGATNVVRHARLGRGQISPWLMALIKRKPAMLAAVALANKMARIAWKLLVSGEAYSGYSASRLAAG
jgi:transposase